MQGELVTIAVDGTTTRQPLDGTDSLPALQGTVGGTIGYVPGFDAFEGRPCDAYVNDEGLLEGLAENPEATRLWRAQLSRGAEPGQARLHGPLAIMTGDRAFMRASREF